MDNSEYNIILSREDRLILESMKSIMDGLAVYLGDGYEFVLHSLDNVERSVIKIINGHHTGRKEGAPITDLALSMLQKIRETDCPGAITYYTRNKKGEPLKSTTIAIRGKEQRIIGLLCINFYLNTPFVNVLGSFSQPEDAHAGYEQENFVDNTEELIRDAYEPLRMAVYADNTISTSQKNKEIISRLNSRGIFKLKNAVIIIAELMGISRNTVYLHLRSLCAKEEK